jgi:hypothetical protein
MLDLHTREGGVENLSNDLVNEARRTWQPRLTPNPGYFLSARRQSECHDLKGVGSSLAYPRRPWSSPLNKWVNQVSKVWSNNNPLGFNETLLVMRAYAPYHHPCAVSMGFAIANNQADRVPHPQACILRANAAGLVGLVLSISPAGCHLGFAWSP